MIARSLPDRKSPAASRGRPARAVPRRRATVEARWSEEAERSSARARPGALASAIGNCAFATLVGRGAGAILPEGTVHTDVEATMARSSGSGFALDASVRNQFAPRLGDPLANVRIHADAGADALARSSAIGLNQVLALQRHLGNAAVARRLVLERSTAPRLQRRVVPLDPANPDAWNFLGSGTIRRRLPEEFEAALGAAPEAALRLETQVGQAGAPKGDPAQERFAAQLQTLMRLNALGLMASHRATIEGRRTAQSPTRAPGAGDRDDETPIAIRAAATQLQRLATLREDLRTDLSRIASIETAVLIQSRTRGRIEDWIATLHGAIQQHQSPEVIAHWNFVLERLPSMPSADAMAGPLSILARYLAAWRGRQIDCVSAAMHQLHLAFPFFAELRPADVNEAQMGNDRRLMEAVAKAYRELMEHIDKAILDIGSGHISAFDLPEAVRLTRQSLPTELRPAIDQVLHSREVRRFWAEMAWTAVQVALVFIPVFGPAIAAAVGLTQVAAEVDALLDRYALAAASGDPERGTLGVDAPGSFEWAMIGVQAALTLGEMRMAWQELAKLRPRLRAAPARLGAGPEGEIPPRRERPAVREGGVTGPVGAETELPSGLVQPGRRLAAGSMRGLPATEETIRVGTVRMDLHPDYPAKVAELKSRGFTLRFTGGSPHVEVADIVSPAGEHLRFERAVYVRRDMRFLDFEHELDHVKQLERLGPSAPPTVRYVEAAGSGGTPLRRPAPGRMAQGAMTTWQDAITEYQNRLVEYLRLHSRGADAAVLREHAAEIREYRRLYYRRGLRGGRSARQQTWAEQHFSDIPDLEARYREVGGPAHETGILVSAGAD